MLLSSKPIPRADEFGNRWEPINDMRDVGAPMILIRVCRLSSCSDYQV